MVEKNTAIGRTETTTAATAIVKSNWKAKIEYTFLMKAHRSCGLSSIIGYSGLAPTSTSFFLYGWVHIFKTFLSLLVVCFDAEKVKDKASFFFFFFVKEEMSFKCGRGREGRGVIIRAVSVRRDHEKLQDTSRTSRGMTVGVYVECFLSWHVDCPVVFRGLGVFSYLSCPCIVRTLLMD